MKLNHITLNTGHVRISERDEVIPKAIEICKDYIRKCLKAQRNLPLDIPPIKDIVCGIVAYEENLRVVVYCEDNPMLAFDIMAPTDDMIRNLTIWNRVTVGCTSPQCEEVPETPWCAVKLWSPIEVLKNYKWLGDFERCMAWAWIEMKEEMKKILF